ncbi:hypothetical protein GGR57DRAFT_321126 [Xylariaceae sp. FL1272]|nr:hypothetical protein GGR57DRAFT_321126 [Xylariaceae sp. FL1272]
MGQLLEKCPHIVSRIDLPKDPMEEVNLRNLRTQLAAARGRATAVQNQILASGAPGAQPSVPGAPLGVDPPGLAPGAEASGTAAVIETTVTETAATEPTAPTSTRPDRNLLTPSIDFTTVVGTPRSVILRRSALRKRSPPDAGRSSRRDQLHNPTHNLHVGEWLYEEYLENGTLERFIERAFAAGEQIPNRVLWAIFSCCMLPFLSSVHWALRFDHAHS